MTGVPTFDGCALLTYDGDGHTGNGLRFVAGCPAHTRLGARSVAVVTRG